MSNNIQNTGASDMEKRLEAARVLRADAETVHIELIDDLSAQRKKLAEQYEKLGREIKDLDGKIGDLSFNLDCLRGVVPTESPVDVHSKKHHIKDEVILAFLVDNGSSTTSEVQEYFKFSSATVCRRLDALLAAKKVTVEKRGTSKIWKAKI